MSSGLIRVAVVSDHEVVATGLTVMLGHHSGRVQVVDLDHAPEGSDPDVILYDVVGLHDGDETRLHDLVHHTSSAVLAVARDLRPDLGARALAIGADGVFSIGVDDKDLLAAVESASAGESEALVASAALEHRLGHDVGLTGREVDVLTMITQGFTNQEIAEQNYLSINSVKTYIRSAYRRIGVTSRSQAVVWALQHGFSTDLDD